MILVIRNTVTNKETFVRLREVKDFEYLFDLFPKTHEIALMSDSLEDAARNIAKYLSISGHCNAWIVDNTMIKKEVDEKEKEVKPKQLSIDSNFSDRFNKWVQKRIKEDRELIPRDGTFVADPGRLREPELDKKPEDGIMGKIKWAIDQVKNRKK